MTHRLHLPAEHPALPGHFPNRPVMPAALLIEAMAGAVEAACERVPRCLRQLRLLQPVSPGQSLPITIVDRGGEEFLLTLWDDSGAVVCKGIFATAAPARSGDWPLAGAAGTVQAAEPLYRQLPYAGAMRLIEQVEFWPDGAAGCDVDIRAGSPLATSGRLSGWTVIEYAAQLVACQGVSGGASQESRLFHPSLAAVRELHCHRQRVAFGDGPLAVRVRPLAQQPGAARFAFRIAQQQGLLTSGDLTVLYQSSGSSGDGH